MHLGLKTVNKLLKVGKP